MVPRSFAGHRPTGNGMGWEVMRMMFSPERMRFLMRPAKCLVCLLVAALLIWRSNVYRDPVPGSMVPSVMCALFALFLVLTGMAVGWEEEEEAEAEVE